MNWGNKKAISVAGGKGGIGKSSFVANMGVALSKHGSRVIVDADIGAANLHTIIGVAYPKKTLADFCNDPNETLENVLVETPYENLRLLSSANDILSIASPNYKMNQRLFTAIQRIKTDIIIFDIAAGTHYRAIDFFALAPVGIIIVEPVPTSLENAFLFFKNLLFRFLLRMFYRDTEMKTFINKLLTSKDDSKILQFNHLLEKLEEIAPVKISAYRQYFVKAKYKMCIVANSVRTPSQQEIIKNFAKIVKRYLGLSPLILGYLPFEPYFDTAISHRTPFVIKYPEAEYTKALNEIINNIPF